MGKKLWLSPGSVPYIFPQDERENLMNRLWKARYLVPTAKTMEIQYLRDIVDMAEKRALEDEEANVRAGQQIVSQMPQNQVVGLLNEYLAWRRKKEIKLDLRRKD